VVARNKANAVGVKAQSVPLRVIPEPDLASLKYPDFLPDSIRALAAAIGGGKPQVEFHPHEYAASLGVIEQGTRELLGSAFAELADLHGATAFDHPASAYGQVKAIHLPELPVLPGSPLLADSPVDWRGLEYDSVIENSRDVP
jgi:hypothetical protein